MADYIDRKKALDEIFEYYKIPLDWDGQITEEAEEIISIVENAPSIDAVEVVRCKDCVYWQDEKIQTENGELRDYLPDEKPFVTIDKGINVEAHCTLHGFEDMSGSWFWAQANDFCSRGVKKNEIN